MDRNMDLEKARALVESLESMEMPVNDPMAKQKQIPYEVDSLRSVLLAQCSYIEDLRSRLEPACYRPDAPNDGEVGDAYSTVCDVADTIRDLRIMATGNTKVIVDILNHLEL